MNIAVINVKDLLKYILKFCLLIAIILLFSKGIKGLISLKNNTNIVKLEQEDLNTKSFTKCLDVCLPIISYKEEKNTKKNVFENNYILSTGSEILNPNILENKERKELEEEEVVVADNYQNTKNIENAENMENIESVEGIEAKKNMGELISNDQEIKVENVSEKNIIPKVTNSYNTVQFNNQSDYELTDEMLAPDVEITNKKDILIYHTHTCESYTPSTRL